MCDREINIENTKVYVFVEGEETFTNSELGDAVAEAHELAGECDLGIQAVYGRNSAEDGQHCTVVIPKSDVLILGTRLPRTEPDWEIGNIEFEGRNMM